MADDRGVVRADNTFIGEAVYRYSVKARIGMVVEIDPLRDNGSDADQIDYHTKQVIKGKPRPRGAYRIMWHDGKTEWLYPSSYSSYYGIRSYKSLLEEMQAKVDKYAARALSQLNKAAVHAGFITPPVKPKRAKTSAKKSASVVINESDPNQP